MQTRQRRIDAESSERRFLDLRHRPSGETRQVGSAQVEIVLAGELGVR